MLQIFLVAVLLVVIIAGFISTARKRKGLPPGPFCFPFLGYLPFIDRNSPFNTIEGLRQKYGDIFYVKLGVRNVVFISDYQIAAEVFGDSDFIGRPDFYTFRTIYHGKLRGITGTSGKLWEEQRRFVFRTLRDFGFGKSSLEDIILTETDHVIQEFIKKRGEPFMITNAFHVAMVNIIWSFISGERMIESDPQSDKITTGIHLSSESASVSILDYIPWLRMFISDKCALTDVIKTKNCSTLPYFTRLVKEHERTYDPSCKRDLIDVYLTKMYKDERNNVEDSTFTREQLYGVLNDLLCAGSNTLSTSLLYSVLLLLKYPEQQERIRDDIRKKVGLETPISLKHIESLPYLQAYLMEVQRYAEPFPIGAPHVSSRDREIRGYLIPKNTVINLNVSYIHKDPRYWKDPEHFNPERFLNTDGTIILNNKGYLPFSKGKRSCPGENFAKMEMFLFIGRILQKVKLSTPAGQKSPSAKPRKFALVSHPEDFQIVASPVES